MEWLPLALLAPLVLVPVVLVLGCAFRGKFLEAGAHPPLPASLVARRAGDRTIPLKQAHSDAAAKLRLLRGESFGSLVPFPALQDITGALACDHGLTEGATSFYRVATVRTPTVSGLFSSATSA